MFCCFAAFWRMLPIYVVVAVVLVFAICRRSDEQPRVEGALPDGCVPADKPFEVPVSHAPSPRLESGHDALSMLKHRPKLAEYRYRDTFDGYVMHDTLRFCEPCGRWFSVDVRIEDVFPLEHLDRAKRVRCFALELEDGTIEYGRYRRHLTSPPAFHDRPR